MEIQTFKSNLKIHSKSLFKLLKMTWLLLKLLLSFAICNRKWFDNSKKSIKKRSTIVSLVSADFLHSPPSVVHIWIIRKDFYLMIALKLYMSFVSEKSVKGDFEANLYLTNHIKPVPNEHLLLILWLII